jgi:DNA-binding MarR family transcriptional regulator
MAKAIRKSLPEAGQGGPVSDRTLRGFAGYNMKRAFNAVQADLARTLEPFGLRMMTFTALVLVIDNPDLSQTQLAGALAVERSNLVVIIDDLEQAGLITRNPSPTDRRSHALRATLAGRRLCKRALQAVRAHEEKLLGGLGENGAAALIAALQTVEQGNRGGE